MQKGELIDLMVPLLERVLSEQDERVAVRAAASSPLVGENAIVTSLSLVSFIADVESILADGYGIDVTLVSEHALSRSKSPFRTIATLADYVVELTERRFGSAV